MNLPRDNKSSSEREVTLAPGQSLPWGSSLSRVHVNRPLYSLFQKGSHINIVFASRDGNQIQKNAFFDFANGSSKTQPIQFGTQVRILIRDHDVRTYFMARTAVAKFCTLEAQAIAGFSSCGEATCYP